MSKVIEVDLEQLEAVKLVNDYMTLFNTVRPYESYRDEVNIHLMAKDCAMVAINKICNLHMTAQHDNLDYWVKVKQYIEII